MSNQPHDRANGMPAIPRGVEPQGMQNPFPPAPVHPTAWSFLPGVQGGVQTVVLMLANPHAMATHWFTIEDFDKFLEDARAARSGLIIAKN